MTCIVGLLETWLGPRFDSGEFGQLLEPMHEIDHNGPGPLLDPLRQKHS